MSLGRKAAGKIAEMRNLSCPLLSSMKNSGVGFSVVSANKRASETAIGRQPEGQLVEHLISILCCEAPKLGVLVQVLVQPKAQLVDLTAVSYRAIEEGTRPAKPRNSDFSSPSLVLSLAFVVCL